MEGGQKLQGRLVTSKAKGFSMILRMLRKHAKRFLSMNFTGSPTRGQLSDESKSLRWRKRRAKDSKVSILHDQKCNRR